MAIAQEEDAGSEAPLYADRPKIYPQAIAGRFRRIKWLVLGALLAIYYLVPWLRWSRGAGAPDQAVLVDLAGRRAYFFSIEIWPQEIYYLAGLLIMGAIGLFLVTSLAGRVWCGFTCPQTVWTDLFMWVERWIEGDRNARMRRDAQPMSLDKAARKALKHGCWLVIAFLTGGAWAMYFTDAPGLVRDLATGSASATVCGFIALFTATTYLLAGWAREQVCIYMCPWPRFQSAMFDEHTFLVTYEDWRGEPRGHWKAGTSFDGRGDCIDCGLCVRVCPTGVDIRKGQQLACIGCGLCIDACNGVMAKIGRPSELITYDSLDHQAKRRDGAPAVPRHLLRPRTMIYGAFLSLAALAMAVSLAGRSDLLMSIQADRAPLFVRMADGDIQNGYTLKIINKARAPRQVAVSLDGLAEGRMTVVGQAASGSGPATLTVSGDGIGTFRIYVRMPRLKVPSGSTRFAIRVADVHSGSMTSHDAIFSAPTR